jgi:hypothetical protein
VTEPVNIPHETGLLLALQRVRGGGVSLLRSGHFTDRGDPFPRVLVPFLRELLDHGQVWLNDGHDVVITDAGEALLAELHQNRDGMP